MAEPARKFATELATDIVKRPAESLTTSGALKVGANKAGKAIGKAAPAIGKGFSIGSLLLNSSPSVAEPKPTDIIKPQKLEVKAPDAEEVPLWKQKTNAMKPNANTGLLSWSDIVKSQGENAVKISAPVTTATEQTENTDSKAKNDSENGKQKLRNYTPELPKTDGNPEDENEKTITPAEQKRLSYNNLYSYYKSGGFGDPASSDAKRDFGFAILDTIGSGLANAGRGIKGQASEASKWDKILAQGKSNQTEFEMLDKQLANNEAFQSYLNNLRKDFEDWSTKYGIKMGNDKEKMEALKKYTAARGNQMENDWKNMLLRGVVTGAETVGTAYLMNRLMR